MILNKLNSPNNLWMATIFIPFYWWANWGREKLSILSKLQTYICTSVFICLYSLVGHRRNLNNEANGMFPSVIEELNNSIFIPLSLGCSFVHFWEIGLFRVRKKGTFFFLLLILIPYNQNSETRFIMPRLKTSNTF